MINDPRRGSEGPAVTTHDPSREIEHGPTAIPRWSRWSLGVVGLSSFLAGGISVFTRSNEAGPVALIVTGAVTFMIGLAGYLPTRLKFGDHEAEFTSDFAKQVRRDTSYVETALDTSGISFASASEGLPTPNDPVLSKAAAPVERLERAIEVIEAKAGSDAVPSKTLLELGRWYLAQQDWPQAAQTLERYVRLVEADWEVYFTLGVAHANRREGNLSNLAALSAYDKALARLPYGQPNKLTARLFSYRAGIKKRLGFLKEARADAEVASQLAEGRYEQIDATYNLACVEAMLGNSAEALRALKKLQSLGGIDLVRGHEQDYFRSLADYPEFHAILAT